jgi:RimJ/RimL family protein N-acetyltransferase
MPRTVRLVMMAQEDVELRLRMETNPGMMADLGGPRPPEAIRRAHLGSLAMAAEGQCWPLKVVVDGETVGEVSIWLSSHDGEPLYEIGWMILPQFQGHGVATQAVRDALTTASATRLLGAVHAFPGVTNVASNRVCEKNNFTNLGPRTVDFGGHDLLCNHWRLELP